MSLEKIEARDRQGGGGMSGHTPGPWIAGAGADGNCHVRGPDFSVVADAGISVRHSSKEQEANARLIAAAPDMLEALQAFIKYGDGTDHSGVQMMLDYDAANDAIRAAIAKATVAA